MPSIDHVPEDDADFRTLPVEFNTAKQRFQPWPSVVENCTEEDIADFPVAGP